MVQRGLRRESTLLARPPWQRIVSRPPAAPPEDNAESGRVLAEAASAEDCAQDDQDDDNHNDQPEQATHRSLRSAFQRGALLKTVMESASRIHPRPPCKSYASEVAGYPAEAAPHWQIPLKESCRSCHAFSLPSSSYSSSIGPHGGLPVG